MSAISKGCAVGAALIAGICVSSGGPDRYGYCSVPGDTNTKGEPLPPGSFLNLELGQPDRDPHYSGAVLAFWVQGVGITCSLTPSQAALAAASTQKVNHTGGTDDPNQPEVYTFVPAD